MKKSIKISILLLVFILLLTACGSGVDEISTDSSPDQGVDSAEVSSETMDEPGQADENNQVEGQAGNTEAGFNVEDPNAGTQLAMLSFSLEDSDLAVTSEQAAVLLPLWQSIQAHSTAEAVDTASMATIYEQIKAAMTAEQLAQLNSAKDSESMQELMASLGIEPGVGPGGRAGGATGGGPAGEAPGEDPPEGNRVSGEGEGSGAPPEGEWTEEQQAAMQAERPGLGGRSMFGQMQFLLEPLIELLQSRAAG